MSSLGEKIFLNLFELKKRLRAKERETLRIPAPISPLASVLICFPSAESDLGPYRHFLEEISGLFPKRQFHMILHRKQVNSIQIPPEAKVFIFDERDQTRFGTLRKSWLSALPQDISLAIDLNETESVWSAHLCFSTHAPLRIAFPQGKTDYFFNILLRSQEGAPFSEKMEHLIRSVRALTEPPKNLAA